jgi:hypothetical protein
MHLPHPPFFAGRQMQFDFDVARRQNSMFALNTMILDQQSFARRDLHDLVHRRSTATANTYR